MKKQSSRFIIAGLIIAWLFDFLFYKKAVGISFPIWVFVSLLILFLIGRLENVKPSRLSYLLAVTALGLSSATLIRLEPFTRFTAVTGTLFLLIVLLITFYSGYWFWYRFVDYFVQMFLFAVGAIVEAGKLMIKPKKAQGAEGTAEPADPQQPTSNRKTIFAVLRGLAFALPIVFVLSALLASADPIFADNLSNIFDIFKIEHFGEFLFRVIYVLMFAYIFTSSILYALFRKPEKEKPDPQKNWLSPFLGNIETSVVLGSIVLLFGAFVLIQVRYFFGGVENINLEGYTYSEYARRGFGELVIVSVLSLLIYLVFHTITKKQEPKQRRIFSILSILMFAEVIVILLSGNQRLGLYEAAYGFSRLRTYSHLFIPWLGALIIAVILLEIFQKQGRFALALLVFSVGFTATMTISNIDGFIAQKNINRAVLSDQEGYHLDSHYLLELSNDAVPVIFREFQRTSGTLHDQLGADLTCRYLDLPSLEEYQWQSYNLGEAQTAKLLVENEDIWLGFKINRSNQEVTINGETYHCNPYGYYYD